MLLTACAIVVRIMPHAVDNALAVSVLFSADGR